MWKFCARIKSSFAFTHLSITHQQLQLPARESNIKAPSDSLWNIFSNSFCSTKIYVQKLEASLLQPSIEALGIKLRGLFQLLKVRSHALASWRHFGLYILKMNRMGQSKDTVDVCLWSKLGVGRMSKKQNGLEGHSKPYFKSTFDSNYWKITCNSSHATVLFKL